MMKKTIDYIRLIRVKHWLKNIIVLIPAFYGGTILEKSTLIRSLWGFIIFSLLSSAIYVLNDLCDREKDRMHPEKCHRPIASGRVSVREGVVLLVICIAVPLFLDLLLCGLSVGMFIPVIYLVLNILYSVELKNRPVIDLVILVSGFVLRMFYGSRVTGVRISSWLYLTLIALSLFMAFGKRRNEKIHCGDQARSVLSKYSEQYLNSSMYMYLGIFLVFYALWSVDTTVLHGMIYTTPLVIIMVMRYTFALENDSSGNPVDMILGDKVLILLGAVYCLFVFTQLYFPEVLNEYLRF